MCLDYEQWECTNIYAGLKEWVEWSQVNQVKCFKWEIKHNWYFFFNFVEPAISGSICTEDDDRRMRLGFSFVCILLNLKAFWYESVQLGGWLAATVTLHPAWEKYGSRHKVLLVQTVVLLNHHSSFHSDSLLSELDWWPIAYAFTSTRRWPLNWYEKSLSTLTWVVAIPRKPVPVRFPRTWFKKMTVPGRHVPKHRRNRQTK